MRMAQAVRLGAWFLVGLNLLLAFGSIGIFMRMAPAITVIIDRNEVSLQACEDMLASLALSYNMTVDEDRLTLFKNAYERAKNNVTEFEEPIFLKSIGTTFHAAFQGDRTARQATVNAIVALGRINREAMIKADAHAQQLGYAGAWGVVFMAGTIFMAGMIFVRRLTRHVVKPIEEIHAVIIAQRNGETLRRCTGIDLSQEIQTIFSGINQILDRCQAQIPTQEHIAGVNSPPDKIMKMQD